MGTTDEAALVAKLRGGDADAFDVVYDRFRARVYGFLLRSCRRADLADDLLQETFLALARAAPTLREDTDLGAWLFAVARNAWRAHRRWQLLDVSRWLVLGAVDEESPLVAGGPTPEDATEASRAAARLERALGDLPESYREVLLLVGVEGMDQAQVAGVLGVSYATLRKRLSRARELLAERLGAPE